MKRKDLVACMFFCLLNLSTYTYAKDSGKEILLTKPSLASFTSKKLPMNMQLNFWNIEKYDGTTWMKFTKANDAVEFFADLTNITPKIREQGVLAYPEVFYGYKPWDSTGISDKRFPLPAKISTLADLRFAFKYSFWYADSLPINFAPEIWLTKTEKPRKVTAGDAEIMIWLYADAQKPAGAIVDSFSSVIVFNGVKKEIKWSIYFASFDWDYIVFQASENLPKEGKIELPIKPLITKTKSVVTKNSSKIKSEDYDNMYMVDFEIGTEFGYPPTTTAAKMGLKFSDFTVKANK
jgi:endoglucanase